MKQVVLRERFAPWVLVGFALLGFFTLGLAAADVPPAAKDAEEKSAPPVDDWQRSQLPKGTLDPKVIEDRQPVKEPLSGPDEFEAFCRVLAYAHSVPDEILARHGRPGVGYESLLNDEQRKNFIGQLLKVRGKLVGSVVQAKGLPLPLKDKGVEALYYAWLAVEGSKDKLVKVYFTEMPKNLDPGERGNFRVTADGYLFKLLSFYDLRDDEEEGIEKRFAPLLLGRTIDVQEEEAPAAADQSDEAKLRIKDWEEWGSVRDERPLGNSADNPEEYRAYNLTIKHVSAISPELLRKHAIKDLVYQDLINDHRRQFLRQPLHIEGGTLVRLREREATGRLAATTDIKKIYEGWVLLDGNMYTVVFTELPEGLKPGKNVNHKVAFDGYYFKLHAYETKDKNDKGEPAWYKAPLLIGRTIEVLDPDPSYWEIANPVIPFILAVFGAAAVIVIGLLVWYRRNDRRIKDQAREAMSRNNPFADRPESSTIEPGSGWNRLGE